MTDKHTAEHSRAACLGIYWPKCDVYIAHTTIKPEVSISLTEMPFLILQVNFHTSNDFVIGVSLTSSESDQYSSAPKEISKLPLMYMTGYFCRSVYIDEHVYENGRISLSLYNTIQCVMYCLTLPDISSHKI